MQENHTFCGAWITDRAFCTEKPVNVFHKQLSPIEIAPCPYTDRHILFRKRFRLENLPKSALLYFSADDYGKLFVNGTFVTQGPAPAYRFAYGYLCVDIAPFLHPGENVLAFHTLYQGLINRVWVSGDHCHGLLFDLIADGVCIAQSDTSVRVALHEGFSPLHTTGYQTQFMEQYDSRAAQVGFERLDFDDSAWDFASERQYTDYTTVPQQTAPLVFEAIRPNILRKERQDGSNSKTGTTVFMDFGSVYVGTLSLHAKGTRGSRIVLRFGQELNADGSVRYELRANCKYEETWILSGGDDILDEYDYKSFRYVSLELPPECDISDAFLWARHYPFTLRRGLKPELVGDERYRRIFDLCAHSLKYGVQEVIQDCMEREKGFYLGDGCYSALAQLILTDDDSIVRKMIEDAFASSFISETLVTCLDCSFMQEIAEYPLFMISLILWHYRIKGDKAYLRRWFEPICRLLDCYRRDYEKEGLLCDLDKWCVVEWPKNFRDGYDVDIEEGKVCHEPHIAINAYYVLAVKTANAIARELELPPYRDETPLVEACRNAFYDSEAELFCDGVHTRHKSYIGNVLANYAGLFPENAQARFFEMIAEKGMAGVSFYGAMVLLVSLMRDGNASLAHSLIAQEDAWLRILREGGTTTFEGWGRDTKWNTSLFHLTLTLASVFLADIDQKALFRL